ncbi:LppU/SCO3897 family protein [Micromonospora sp. CA-246542]|uniref:LppU/SCO3897 family protein n=1 Tax=Micromonospora sp. CA-246542 TaxID=3239959 RepID=UPI003D93A82F
MSEQVAPPPASDAAPAQPAAETPAQPAVGTPAQPAVETPPPAEPEGKSGGKKALGIIGAIVIFLVIAGLKFGLGAAIGNFVNKDETADAKAGDCIAELPEIKGDKEEEVDGAKVVECTSTDAAYNVVGRLDGQTETQAKSETTCNEFFKEGEEGYVFYSIESGKKGYVLCLTKKA